MGIPPLDEAMFGMGPLFQGVLTGKPAPWTPLEQSAYFQQQAMLAQREAMDQQQMGMITGTQNAPNGLHYWLSGNGMRQQRQSTMADLARQMETALWFDHGRSPAAAVESPRRFDENTDYWLLWAILSVSGALAYAAAIWAWARMV